MITCPKCGMNPKEEWLIREKKYKYVIRYRCPYCNARIESCDLDKS